MERYFGLDAARSGRRPGARRVATIGFFDGVHRGHVKLLDDLKDWAEEAGTEPAVVTFRRHPQAVLGSHPPSPVVSLEHRLLLLERHGIAATLVLEFDEGLRAWSPEEFVRLVFSGALGATAILMGFDSAFGHGRRGTFEYLRSRQGELGIEVRRSGAETFGGERVSSTLVREAIARWDLARLERLLGRRFALLGRVVAGDGRGRGLGFPTANLDLGAAAVPPPGVYFADVLRLGREPHEPVAGRELLPAVVNIGRRPTVTGGTEAAPGDAYDPTRDRVEVHVLDFEGDLYGEYLEVTILARHRAERRFANRDELAAAIREDVARRRRWA